MIVLILLAIWVGIGAYFAWLYWVSPQSDQERIKADQAGAGALGFTIKRTGTKYFPGRDIWVADRSMVMPSFGWCRIYEVSVERSGGALETYSIAVQAKLFGLSAVSRLDPRAGE